MSRLLQGIKYLKLFARHGILTRASSCQFQAANQNYTFHSTELQTIGLETGFPLAMSSSKLTPVSEDLTAKVD